MEADAKIMLELFQQFVQELSAIKDELKVEINKLNVNVSEQISRLLVHLSDLLKVISNELQAVKKNSTKQIELMRTEMNDKMLQFSSKESLETGRSGKSKKSVVRRNRSVSRRSSNESDESFVQNNHRKSSEE